MPRKYTRKTKVSSIATSTPEAPPTRLDQLRVALKDIKFGYTIFFTDEEGKKNKYGTFVYQEIEGSEDYKAA